MQGTTELEESDPGHVIAPVRERRVAGREPQADLSGSGLAACQRRAAEEWEHLAPRGLYARYLRHPLLYLVSLVLALPAFALAVPVALLNALVHGSLRRAFFCQERVGLRGRPYTILKFRTLWDDPGLSDAERVTPLGRVLRNTHLDELPQFWNVLTGEMCLIGPRPEMVETERWAAQAIEGFSDRLVLRPGITGLAQITQGYAQDGDLDAYVCKAALNEVYRGAISPGLDLAILSRTAIWMLARKGWRTVPPGAEGAPGAEQGGGAHETGAATEGVHGQAA